MNWSTKRIATVGIHRLVLLTGIAVPLLGYTGPCSTAQSAFRDDTDNVITFSVLNRWGRFVSLGRDDFTIYEEHRPQKTLKFFSESELPLRVALLLDTSNSVREHFGAIQDAAAGFIQTVLRAGCDQAMLVSFDTVSEVAASFSDPKEVAEKIRNLRPGGGTALYDAIDLSARRMSDAMRGTPGSRLAIVILSDGDDNQSRLTRDQALEYAQKANAVIFAVSTSMQRIPTIGDRVLKYLTSETGGIAVFPSSTGELGRSFTAIAQLQHHIRFRTGQSHVRTMANFHALESRPKSKGVTIRARKGYYAPTALRDSESSENDR